MPEDKFHTSLNNLKGLAQTLTEAPTEDAMALSHQDLRVLFVQSQVLHKVVGQTLLEACKQLEKYR